MRSGAWGSVGVFRGAGLLPLLALFLAPGPPAGAQPVGTAFTYQGQLQQSGAPTNGSCDFQFSLWDALGSGAPPTGGSQIGSTQTKSAVNVTNGVFTLPLDFGAAAFSSASENSRALFSFTASMMSP